jgi:hypothetical protein
VDQVRIFGFDQDHLVERLKKVKLERGITFDRMVMETGISTDRLKWYLSAVKRRPGSRPTQMTMELAMRFMMWLEDYDIRDYLKEERR